MTTKTKTGAHLDYRHLGEGRWEVFCQGAWCPVLRDPDGRFCQTCGADVSQRFVKPW